MAGKKAVSETYHLPVAFVPASYHPSHFSRLMETQHLKEADAEASRRGRRGDEAAPATAESNETCPCQPGDEGGVALTEFRSLWAPWLAAVGKHGKRKETSWTYLHTMSYRWGGLAFG
jgi:hypothetical protein